MLLGFSMASRPRIQGLKQGLRLQLSAVHYRSSHMLPTRKHATIPAVLSAFATMLVEKNSALCHAITSTMPLASSNGSRGTPQAPCASAASAARPVSRSSVAEPLNQTPSQWPLPYLLSATATVLLLMMLMASSSFHGYPHWEAAAAAAEQPAASYQTVQLATLIKTAATAAARARTASKKLKLLRGTRVRAAGDDPPVQDSSYAKSSISCSPKTLPGGAKPRYVLPICPNI